MKFKIFTAGRTASPCQKSHPSGLPRVMKCFDGRLLRETRPKIRDSRSIAA